MRLLTPYLRFTVSQMHIVGLVTLLQDHVLYEAGNVSTHIGLLTFLQ